MPKTKPTPKPVNSMWVCRGPDGYLGKAGVNLSLTSTADLIHASPFATREDAEIDVHRASQILGVAFTLELRQIADLVPKKEKPKLLT